MIPRQPVFALSSECYVLSREAMKINFIVFGLTRLGKNPTQGLVYIRVRDMSMVLKN
jgi:hypothetical protein